MGSVTMTRREFFDAWLQYARSLNWSPERRNHSCQLAFTGLNVAMEMARRSHSSAANLAFKRSISASGQPSGSVRARQASM